MSADDTIAHIASLTLLTEADIEGLRNCTPAEVAVILRSYINDGKIADRGLLVTIGNALKQAGEYAPIGGLILSAIPLL